MAVTRHCRAIYAASGHDMMPELQKKLNEALGPNERIVHMSQAENRSSMWYVVTEELIMGPSP